MYWSMFNVELDYCRVLTTADEMGEHMEPVLRFSYRWDLVK